MGEFMSHSVSKLTLLALAASTLALSACSEIQAQTEDRFAKVEIKTTKLAPGVAVLFGAGGNIGVSYGPDGTVLVDDQFAPLTGKIQAAVKALGAQPTKYLINTHWHYDHTGGNENIGKTGALIMAHDNVRVRMLGEQKTGRGNTPASPPAALPVVTYHDGLKLHLNGDEVRTIHMHDGHTDGDSIVVWKKANVIHMGDLFFNKVTFPFIDLNSGGNVRGVLHAAEKALKLANDDTQIIPGHGPMATKADLVAYRDMLKAVVSIVGKAKHEGKGLAQIQAMKPVAKWDNNPKAFISADKFVEAVFKSLDVKAGKKHHKH